MAMTFKTTVKNGLPVMVEAEFDGELLWVCGMYWLTSKGRQGKSVPDCIYNAVTANTAELYRLNREAHEEYDSNRDYYNS